MQDAVAVGLGCFWFGIKGGRPEQDGDFDPARHIKQIKQALSRIPNITEVELEESHILAYGYGNPTDVHPEEDFSFFPTYAHLSIRIGIYIPRRLQNEIAYYPEDAPVDTETFHVLITYRHHPMPTTFVYYKTASDRPDPSTAVMIIRKYLEQEFVDDYATFCSLGPSPFHADLLLRRGAPDDPTVSIHDMSTVHGGYKRYEIVFAEDARLRSLLLAFVTYIGPFLSLYYALERDRVNLMYLSDQTERGIQRLLEIERVRGIRRHWYHLFRTPRIISAIMVAMLEVEAERTRSATFYEEKKSEVGVLGATPFQIFLDRARRERFGLPTSEMREIVRLFEGRHLRLTENVAVLVAGLLGGIIGALLTWTLSRHSIHS